MLPRCAIASHKIAAITPRRHMCFAPAALADVAALLLMRRQPVAPMLLPPLSYATPYATAIRRCCAMQFRYQRVLLRLATDRYASAADVIDDAADIRQPRCFAYATARRYFALPARYMLAAPAADSASYAIC